MTNRLRELIDRSGKKQHTIADEAGTTPGNISKLASKAEIDPKWARRLAPALGVSPDEILTDVVRVPLLYRVRSFDSDENSLPDLTALRITVPAHLKKPEACFAAFIQDNSANRMYPSGSIVIVRPIEALERPLMIGAKVLVQNYLTDLAHNDPFEYLVGILDKPVTGDIVVSLRSDNKRMAGSIVVRRPPSDGGLNERTIPMHATMVDPIVEYQPQPTDRARILGQIVLAITPE